MATAADSPQFRRNSPNLSSPWSHVVRGEPPEPAPPAAVSFLPHAPPSPSAAEAAPPREPSDRSSPNAAPMDNPPSGSSDTAASAPFSDVSDSGGNVNRKKQAWNMPSNGLIETAGPVMGASSWPALSEATKALPKLSSTDSLKALGDGSVSALPGPMVASPAAKPITTNPNVSSSPSHAAPVRQKSMRRGGGSGNNSDGTSSSGAALANGGPVPPLVVPTSAEIPKVTLDRTVTQEPSPRNGSNWDHGSRSVGSSPQPNGGNEHYRGYGGNRRGNNSGPHHGSYGNRRGQDHGDWNHRNFGGGRDVQMQQRQQYQRPMSRPYPRPPPLVTPPFFAPPPPPFGVPIGFPDMGTPVFYVQQHLPPESLRAMPFVAPLPMFFPPPDSHLRAMLVKQIDYYFSTENLCSDTYLREKMDGEGWVPISLIANFNRVKQLTNHIQFILDAVQNSAVVEVQGDKIRRRNDWMNWILPAAPNATQSRMPDGDYLAARVRSIGLEEGTTADDSTRDPLRAGVVLSRSSSEELNSRLQVVTPSSGNGSRQNTIKTASDGHVSGRSLNRNDTF